MAVNMKNVKAITHNNKQVSKIEDSNGNIIWGSYDAFPYRRLEYIHFNGTDNYIDSGLYPLYPKNKAVWIKVDSDITTTSARILGSYNGNSTDAARRYYLVVNRSSGFGAAYGNQWAGGLSTSYLTKPVLLWATQNNTGKVMYVGVKSFDDQTTYTASTTITTTSAIQTSVKICIGSNFGAGGQTDTNAMYKGRLYLFRCKNTNGSGAIENEMIPAQRKSDGVCGLYDTETSTFHPMQGSNVTTAAAGPTIDEYWDLTSDYSTPPEPIA